jgi:UDPglucose--hexose-1-phosphate uridylyltransferase
VSEENFRRHLITGERILFAPDRALRPHAFGEPSRADERCPFCPGHESDTPPAIVQRGDPWQVRVFPNKYPPIPGAEVIVESPRHEDTFERIEDPEKAVAVYLDRYRAHGDAAFVSIFKNEGSRAGSSISHVHSQVVPLPFVPPRIAREAAAFAAMPFCPLCSAIETHRESKLMVGENASFAWLTPSSSAMPYQQWIIPKRHVAEIAELSAEEAEDLAALLRSAAGAMLSLSDAFNWTFISFPGSGAAHGYIDLFPRLTAIAGFELGTGTFVEIIEPAAAARRLRNSGY